MRKWLSIFISLVVVIALVQTDVSTTNATIATGQADLILGDASYGGSTGDGTQFGAPYGVSVDAVGNVYVSDGFGLLVKAYTEDGVFIRSLFGGEWTGPSPFTSIDETAIDSNNNIYVVNNMGNIKKFDASGQLLWTSNSYPYIASICVDAAGNLYLTDSQNHRIVKLDPSGNQIMTFGSSGSGAGQFNWPSGIDVDASGNIYVSEMNGNRVQKFTSAGTIDTSFGTGGIAASGQFNHPSGLGVDSNGNIYVADTQNYRVVKLSAAGAVVGTVGTYGTGDTQFQAPYAVEVSHDNKIYVTDNSNLNVTKFDSNLTFIRKWGTSGTDNGQFRQASDAISDSNGNIYAVDRVKNQVQKFSANGTFLGLLASGNGTWNSPNAIAIDGAGQLYVLEEGSRRMQVFDATGQYLRSVNVTSGFSSVVDFAVDPAGNAYILQGGFMSQPKVRKYDATGTFLIEWGSSGSGDGQFSNPKGIAIDPEGNVLTVDQSLGRITKFSPSGTFISRFGSIGSGVGQLNYPTAIAVDLSGNIFVAEQNDRRVSVFDSSYSYIRSFGSLGYGVGQFQSFAKMSIGSNGDLFVADSGAYRISRFNLLSASPSPTPTAYAFVHTTGVTLDKDKVELINSRHGYLIAEVMPYHASNQEVIWSSSDERVVSVDAKGILTATGFGKAVVTVKTKDGGHFAEATVTVPGPVKVDAKRVGYISGYADGTFRPDASVTRGELAVMMARNMKLGDGTVEGSLQAMKEKGLILGNGKGNYYPNQRVTKAMWNTIAKRYLGDKSPFGYTFAASTGNELLTREQAVIVLNKLFEITLLDKVDKPTFKDVSSKHRSFIQIESAIR